MFWKKLENDIFEKQNKKTENRKNNPFSVNRNYDFQTIWEQINTKTQELSSKCYPNTYVWIEKFKEDNFL